MTKHLFRDVSYSKDTRRELWSTLSYHCAENDVYQGWKRSVILEVQTITLVRFAASHSGMSVWKLWKNNLTQTLIHRDCWKAMIANKNKKKEAKTKPTWSNRISYCRLLILFSFIVVPNVSPSYWDGCYLCTLQKEMIKEDFFPVWETNLFFLCVLCYSVEGETDSKTNVSYI